MFKARLAIIIMVFSLIFSAVALAETAAQEAPKKVDVSASLDIGNNAKELLANGGDRVVKIIEQLASSLRMSVNELFPYYVRQSSLNGWLPILVWCGFEIFCLILIAILICFYFGFKKNNPPITEKNKDDTRASDVCGVATIILCLIFLVGLFVGIVQLPDWVTLIKNPEYAAIHNLINDASQLIKK